MQQESFLIVRETGEYLLDERKSDKDGEGEDELFPFESDNEHSYRIGEKSDRQEPEARIDREDGVPEISRHSPKYSLAKRETREKLLFLSCPSERWLNERSDYTPCVEREKINWYCCRTAGVLVPHTPSSFAGNAHTLYSHFAAH